MDISKGKTDTILENPDLTAISPRTSLEVIPGIFRGFAETNQRLSTASMVLLSLPVSTVIKTRYSGCGVQLAIHLGLVSWLYLHSDTVRCVAESSSVTVTTCPVETASVSRPFSTSVE